MPMAKVLGTKERFNMPEKQRTINNAKFLIR